MNERERERDIFHCTRFETVCRRVSKTHKTYNQPHTPPKSKNDRKTRKLRKNHYKKNQLHIKRDKEYIRKNQMTKVKIGKAL